MTPAQLDLLMQGDFIYERADGSTFTSSDYKLRDYGVKIVGRTGPIFARDRDRDPEGDETRSGSVERSEIEPGPKGSPNV